MVKYFNYPHASSMRLPYLLRVLKKQSINGKEHQRGYRNPVGTLSRVIEVSKDYFVAAHSNIRLSKLPDQHSRIDHNKKRLLVVGDDTKYRPTSQRQSSDHRRPQRPSRVEKEKVASVRDLPKESRRRNGQYSASQDVAG
jgi:hypothetical protein